MQRAMVVPSSSHYNFYYSLFSFSELQLRSSVIKRQIRDSHMENKGKI